jgi:hypothetical protein
VEDRVDLLLAQHAVEQLEVAHVAAHDGAARLGALEGQRRGGRVVAAQHGHARAPVEQRPGQPRAEQP